MSDKFQSPKARLWLLGLTTPLGVALLARILVATHRAKSCRPARGCASMRKKVSEAAGQLNAATSAIAAAVEESTVSIKVVSDDAAHTAQADLGLVGAASAGIAQRAGLSRLSPLTPAAPLAGPNHS